MNHYLIAFPDEERALIELEPFGYSVIVANPEDETGTEVVYAWQQGAAMVGGTQVILSYKAALPTLAPGFWVSLLSREPDDELWEAFSPDHPIIELGAPEEPADPVTPSQYVVRSANLDFDIDTIAGISPVWAGMPDMGFPYENMAA